MWEAGHGASRLLSQWGSTIEVTMSVKRHKLVGTCSDMTSDVARMQNPHKQI